MKPAKIIKRYANRKLYDTDRSCYVTLDEISQMVKEGDDVQILDNRTKDDLTAVTLAQIIVEEEKKVARMPLKLLRSIIQSGNEAVTDFYQRRLADPVLTLREDVERKVEGLFRRDDRAHEDAEGDEGDDPRARTGHTEQDTTLPPEGARSSGPDTAAAPGQQDESVAPGDGGRRDDAVGAEVTPPADDRSAGARPSGQAPSGPGPDAAERAHPVKEWVSATQEALESFQRRVDEQVRQTLGRMGHLGTVGSDVESLRERIAQLEARLAQLEGQQQEP